MIKGILLDIDGTVVQSNDAHASSWSEAFHHFGHKIDFRDIRLLIGMGGDKIFSTLTPEISKEEQKKISEFRKKLFFDKYLPELEPVKGARELIQALLNRELKVIVASSASEQEVKALLKAGNADDLLHQYTTSSDVEESKPEPDIVEAALTKIQLLPDEVYMIGDTPYDIAAAKRTRVRTLAVRSGGFSDKSLSEAYRIYDNLASIKKDLDNLLKS